MPKFFNTLEAQVGNFTIQNSADDKDIIFNSDNGSGGLTEYIRLDGSATEVVFSKDIHSKENIYVGDNKDLYIFHNGNDSYIQHVGTGDLFIKQNVADRDIGFYCDDGSGGETEYFRIDGGSTDVRFSKNLRLLDNVRAEFGNSGNFIIRHDGDDTILQCGSGGGNLTLQVAEDDHDMIFQCDDGSGGVTTYFMLDGSQKYINVKDNITFTIGSGNDLRISHDGSDSKIENYTGNLTIQQRSDNDNIAFQCDDGSGGLTEYFRLDGGDERVLFSKEIRTIDNVKIQAGTGGDLDIFHTGSNATIDNATGTLIIQNSADDSDISFRSDDGSGGVTEYFRVDGSSEAIIVSKTLRASDNVRIDVGGATDGRFFHDGTDTFLTTITGDLIIKNSNDDGDIKFQSDDGSGGTATYFRLDGGLADSGELKTLFPDDSRIVFGTGADFNFYHDGTDSRIQNTTGHIRIINFADDSDIIFSSDDGSGGITEYFRVDGGAEANIFSKNVGIGTSSPDSLLEISSSSVTDFLKLTSGGSSANPIKLIFEKGSSEQGIIEYNRNGDLEIYNTDGDGGVMIDGSASAGADFYINNSGDASFGGNVALVDNAQLRIGSGTDLQILHDASDSFIINNTGDLYLRNLADDKDIIFQSDDGSGGVTTYFKLDGSSGYTIVSKKINFEDDVELTLGSGNDLKIKHDGSNSSIINAVGNLEIRNNTDDGDILFYSDDGSGGTTEYFKIDGTNEVNKFSKHAQFLDSVEAKFGNGGDLRIYHDGSNSYIQDSGTGGLYIKGSNFVTIQSAGGENMIKAIADGSIELYENNVKKFETTTSGISVTGGITLSGDVEGRKIPCIVTTGWGDDVSTTSNRIIPLGNSVTDTTVSAADGFHFVVMPYAGNVKKIVMKNVAGTLSSSFTTELKLYKNGANVTSSGELTASSSAITWEPSSSNTFSANDEISLVYQKSASSKYWREVSLTMVLEFTGQDI